MQKRMCTFIAVSVVVGVLTGCQAKAGEIAPAQTHWSLDDSGVGLQGYSPVSYFQRNKAERGSAEFEVEHDGIKYHLTDGGQVELFEADPRRYAPAHGGWCTLMLAGSGNRVAANPEVFRVVDDRLFLIFHGSWGEAFVDGNALWGKKGGPQAIREADSTWQRVLAGKKKSKILQLP